MGITLNSKAYDRDKFINLGREKTDIDMSSPDGKVTFNKIQQMMMTGDYEDAGNLLALHKAVNFVDKSATNVAQPYDSVEIMVWDDNGTEHVTETPVACNAATNAGWKFVGTRVRTKYTDGTLIDK